MIPKTLLGLLLLAQACYWAPKPEPDEPKIEESCEAACAHLSELGCDEAKPLEDGTSCVTFCENTTKAGHSLGLACITHVASCKDVPSCR